MCHINTRHFIYAWSYAIMRKRKNSWTVKAADGAFSTEENNQIAQKAIADYFEWSGKGLTSYEDYTYSPAYTVSNFLTGETLDDWVNVIVEKDGDCLLIRFNVSGK